ncbi:hypothetical protein FALBO_9703 [Fusarium albosuccineum]|uniref:Uncharacterized protein n=1 Tax=Fusarium albosuccineum TaxID=1237068 RepID=A0A8H4PIW5_9HYPO|nr:hypothetical protein FALBO_9703 [Fusarium albosuccineum]
MQASLQATILLLLLLHFRLVAARRGGGSRGGSSGDGGSSGGGGGGGYGGGSGSGGSSGGSGGGTEPIFHPYNYYNNGIDDDFDPDFTCGLGTCGCQQLTEREIVYGIPGLYYNGTLTVRHHITNSTSWIDKGSGACGMSDDSPKTYKYPALFLVAPTGNRTDTNPFHWRLFGFQPADQTAGATGRYLDVFQRWINLRSSDYVLSNTPWSGNYFEFEQEGRYTLSDGTNAHENTTVYWSTNITDENIENLSARAVYKRKPPPLNDNSYQTEVASSQYLTLSDVCAWNFEVQDEDPVTLPPSKIPKGNDYFNTTTPTFWLQPGAVAEMKGIGATEMTLTLNQSLNTARPFLSQRQAVCGKGRATEDDDYYLNEPFEFVAFWHLLHADGVPELPYWLLDLSISLSFEGNLVSENSTRINGTDKDHLIFESTYETPPPDYTQTSNSGGSGSS